jgi:hypothetical protein
MTRSVKIMVALLCIVCVLALCIAPYVDIPVTALRSLQTLLVLMFALAGALVFIDSSILGLGLSPRALLRPHNAASCLFFVLPIEASCVQQC